MNEMPYLRNLDDGQRNQKNAYERKKASLRVRQ